MKVLTLSYVHHVYDLKMIVDFVKLNANIYNCWARQQALCREDDEKISRLVLSSIYVVQINYLIMCEREINIIILDKILGLDLAQQLTLILLVNNRKLKKKSRFLMHVYCSLINNNRYYGYSLEDHFRKILGHTRKTWSNLESEYS